MTLLTAMKTIAERYGARGRISNVQILGRTQATREHIGARRVMGIGLAALLALCLSACGVHSPTASVSAEKQHRELSFEGCTVRVPNDWSVTTFTDNTGLPTLRVTPDSHVPNVFLEIRKPMANDTYELWKRAAIAMTKHHRDSLIASHQSAEISQVLQVDRSDATDIYVEDSPKRSDQLPMRFGFVVCKPSSKGPRIFPYVMELPRKETEGHTTAERGFEDVISSVTVVR